MSKKSWQWEKWRADENGEADCGVYFEERSGMAHSVCRCPRYLKKEEWEEYARMIAAAPDLLAILERIINRATASMGEVMARTSPVSLADLEDARKIIAQAKEESS